MLDPAERAFGGRVVVTLEDGSVVEDSLAVADAHPLGARPFGRQQYVDKFQTLSDGVVSADEQERFVAAAQGLSQLTEVGELFPRILDGYLDGVTTKEGLL